MCTMLPWAVAAVACCCVLGAAAQTTQTAETHHPRSRPHRNRVELSLSSGVALPTGTFGRKYITDYSGYAQTGWNLQGEATYYFWGNLGVTAVAGYLSNSFDSKAAGISGPVSSYDTWRAMVGPSYRIPLGNKWALKATLLAGEQSKNTFPDNRNVSSFAEEGALAVCYTIDNHWFLSGSADFYKSRFPIIADAYITSQLYPYPTVYKIHQNVAELNLGAGFRF